MHSGGIISVVLLEFGLCIPIQAPTHAADVPGWRAHLRASQDEKSVNNWQTARTLHTVSEKTVTFRGGHARTLIQMCEVATVY
jgi:hypothetical protein